MVLNTNQANSLTASLNDVEMIPNDEGSTAEPQAAEANSPQFVYKIVHFGPVTSEVTIFANKLDLPLLNGFELLQESNQNYFGFNWESFEMTLEGRELNGKTWEEVDLKESYDGKKETLRKDQFFRKNPIETYPFKVQMPPNLSEWDDNNPFEGNWYYKTFTDVQDLKNEISKLQKEVGICI